MTSSKFDNLTRSLANSTSRRETMKILFAGALGGVLGFGGLGMVQAASCKPLGSACTRDRDCCSGLCTGTVATTCDCGQSGATCNRNSNCCPGFHCSNGKCKK